MSKKTILVTGASSGLGQAFLQHYTSLGHNTIGIDRGTISTASSIKLENIDITDTAALGSAANAVEVVFGNLDMIIHCAGVRGLIDAVETTDATTVAQAETKDVMTKQTMMKTFEINTVGTFLLLRTMIPILLRTPNAKVIVMSSRMGSITSNTTGGGYAYRASKAALNAVVRSFSIDTPEIVFLGIHPGRVETGLTKGREEGAFELSEVMPDMLNVIEQASKIDSGRFVDRWGKDIPW